MTGGEAIYGEVAELADRNRAAPQSSNEAKLPQTAGLKVGPLLEG
jgi:hypothetical protein